MRETETHVYFWGDKDPFSNFFHSPFVYKGYQLLFSEQAFMLEKALLFDKSKVAAIVNAKTPKEAKAQGRKVRNYNDQIWSAKRYNIMVNVLKEKFRSPEMRQILLNTGDKTLVEGSPFDKIWGVGIANNDDRILNEANWRGKNLLGKALEEVRDYYR